MQEGRFTRIHPLSIGPLVVPDDLQVILVASHFHRLLHCPLPGYYSTTRWRFHPSLSLRLLPLLLPHHSGFPVLHIQLLLELLLDSLLRVSPRHELTRDER